MNYRRALHYAAMKNSKEVGQLLISKYSNINELSELYYNYWKRPIGGRLPLHYAAMYNSTEMAELLLY